MIVLNLTRCGELLVNSVMASHGLRHKTVKGTMVYVHPTTAEERFVYDVLSGLGTEVLMARWIDPALYAAAVEALGRDPQEAP
jgi:hypothetical protein